jgi:shikimate dehydrogenase
VTRYLGVIGHPLKRSLSPMFQQAAIDHLGLDLRYEAMPTSVEALAETVASLRGTDRLGANVTIPHKEAVIPLLDEIDELAGRVGAVNTIVNRGGRLHGYNTDVAGFLRALREDGGFEPSGARALVAGAGGSARAVGVALVDAEAASVTFINRTLARASNLVDDLRAFAESTQLHALPDVAVSWLSAVAGCRLLINCTSIGMAGGMAGTPEEKDSPVPVDIIPPNALVFDLIYQPPETPLMAAARERGARVLGGLPMLVYQGAESFKLWTAVEAPVAVMRQAAERALAVEA